MDLVEIRKKAKKLKEKKPSSKKKREERSPDDVAEPGAGVEVEEVKSTGEAADSSGGKEKQKPADVLDLLEAAMPESEAAAGQPAPAGENQGDVFLSNVMDALSVDSYEEVDDEEDQERLELLCFKLSDEEYAVEINDVREIVKMVDITEVPKTPDFMLGIISLRGVIIPLLDLRMRLGLDACDYNSKTRIIIASSEDRKMGMVVDAVTEVIGLKKGILEPPPTLLTDINIDLLKGVGRYDERLLIVPNLDRVFDIET